MPSRAPREAGTFERLCRAGKPAPAGDLHGIFCVELWSNAHMRWRCVCIFWSADTATHKSCGVWAGTTAAADHGPLPGGRENSPSLAQHACCCLGSLNASMASSINSMADHNNCMDFWWIDPWVQGSHSRKRSLKPYAAPCAPSCSVPLMTIQPSAGFCV